jgi:proteasome accessory factor A
MRIVGIETEYGITLPDDPRANPIALSATLVSACREWAGAQRTLWDYGGEDPLHDLRGVRRSRASATPSMLTDAPGYDPAAGMVTLRRRRGSWEDPAHLNAVLANGARFYVDHAHPEYSGPEVASARDAVVWDRAGDAIVAAANVVHASREGHPLALYKNNVDGKGASYGTHENFQVSRATDFDTLARWLTPHLVTRQVYTGAGRVGLGAQGEEPGFQISQRADYIEAEIGLETTLRRPIINTRDEPHADRRQWRRLHVIIGDANCFEVPTYLKIGTTALVLAAIEAGDERLEAMALREPVGDVQRVSRDLTLRERLRLADGGTATALEIQRGMLEVCRAYVRDEAEALVLARWEKVLDALSRDIFAAVREVEWLAKLQLMGRLRERHATADAQGTSTLLEWSDARLAAADVQWSEVDKGLAARLERAGAVERITTDEEVRAAMRVAPANTRAALRGGIIAAHPEWVDAAGWSTVVLDRDTDHGELEVVHLDDPSQTSHPLLDTLMGA